MGISPAISDIPIDRCTYGESYVNKSVSAIYKFGSDNIYQPLPVKEQVIG